MNERTALAVIDKEHGSLEDFAIFILAEKTAALDEDIPLPKRAEMVGLPIPVFARILASPQFRALLRTDIVNSAFGIQNEQKHIESVVKVARGDVRTVMSASGKIGEVDPAPGDLIAAGKYLNELRGTPIEKSQQQAPSLVINIGSPATLKEGDDPRTIQVDVESYQPQRAGGLPPSGVRDRFAAPARRDSLPQPQVDAGLGGIYGPSAEESDEDHKLAEKQKRGEVANDPERPTESEPQRGGWSRKWPGRGLPRPSLRSPSRSTIDD